jgi:hypothetical protein
LSHDAPERRLNVSAWAAKSIVKIQMPERGVEVVAPEQADDAPPEPDAFRVTGGTVNRARGFGEFVGLSLTLLARVGGLSLRRLVCGFLFGSLSQRNCRR